VTASYIFYNEKNKNLTLLTMPVIGNEQHL
jgi:hypothetical protein